MSNTSAAGLGSSPCEQCNKAPFKYRCPKCALKTCSLECSKQHKVDNECDGERAPFDNLKRLAEYDDSTSVRDQKFFKEVRNSFNPGEEQVSSVANPNHIGENLAETGHSENIECSSEAVDEPSLGSVDRYLRTACHRRRVWLTFDKDHVADGSRHEQFSDTIMWTIDMKFVKEISHSDSGNAQNMIKNEGDATTKSEDSLEEVRDLETDSAVSEEVLTDNPAQEDGELVESCDMIESDSKELFVKDIAPVESRSVSEYMYTVNGIPDSLTVSTLLRQFVKPKKVGPVVSRSDLDEEKMKPFFDAGMDNVVMYMKVPTTSMDRYYCIDTSKSILDNLRNRMVVGHPTFTITLGSECHGITTISEQEAQELRDAQRSEYQKQRTNSGRGGGRGGRGGNRGGFPTFQRGGGRGGFRGGKRPYDNREENDRRGGKFPRRGRAEPRFDPLDMSNAAMKRCGAFKQE